MTKQEFITFDKQKQFATVLEQGFLIGTKHNKQNIFSLYLLNLFYVEVQYHDKQLRHIFCLSDAKCLDLYPKRLSNILFQKKLARY